MNLGSVMGVNLRVHYLFLLLLLLWAVTGQLVTGSLAFLAVLLHELGHLLAARRESFSPSEVALLPFGGVVRMDEEIGLEPEKEMRIALAGPWVNVLLIGLTILTMTLWDSPAPHLDFFLRINIMLVVFNLLPALPLDGGRIFRAYLVREHGFRAGTIRAARASKLFSLVFLVAGLALALLGSPDLQLILIGGFLYASAVQATRQNSYHLLSYLSRKQREIARLGNMRADLVVVSIRCRGLDLLDRFTPQRYHLFCVVDREGRVAGLLTEQQVLDAIFAKGLEVTMHDLLG